MDRIYVLEMKPDGDPHFLLGEGVMDDANPGSVLSAHARECQDRGSPVTTEIYEDSDVQWISAFHPLRDRNGRVVAVLGADQRASDLKVEVGERLKSTLLSGLAAAAVARSSSPREVLDRVNQQLLMRSTRGLFVTMTYLALEAQTGELCYATAGHLPMLRRSGATQEVEILYGDDGLPLGIEKNSLLADRKIQLAAGDTLLLVTDGVVEALGPDRDHFQMDKLAEIFRQAGSGASQLVEDIFEEIGRIFADASGR